MSDQLEKEFNTLFNSFGQEIEDKVQQAEKLMNEAIEIADRYGIPFSANMFSSMRGWYVPETFADRFSALDKEMVMELTDISTYRLGRANGWQYSNIC